MRLCTDSQPSLPGGNWPQQQPPQQQWDSAGGGGGSAAGAPNGAWPAGQPPSWVDPAGWMQRQCPVVPGAGAAGGGAAGQWQPQWPGVVPQFPGQWPGLKSGGLRQPAATLAVSPGAVNRGVQQHFRPMVDPGVPFLQIPTTAPQAPEPADVFPDFQPPLTQPRTFHLNGLWLPSPQLPPQQQQDDRSASAAAALAPPSASPTPPAFGGVQAVRTAVDLLRLVSGDWVLTDALPRTDTLFAGLRVFADASFSCSNGLVKDGRVVAANIATRELTLARRSEPHSQYSFTVGNNFQTLSGRCTRSGRQWWLRKQPRPETGLGMAGAALTHGSPTGALPFASPTFRDPPGSSGDPHANRQHPGSSGSSLSSSMRVRNAQHTPSGPPSQLSCVDRWSEPSSSSGLFEDPQLRRRWLGEAFRAGRISAALTGTVPKEYQEDGLLARAFLKGQRVRDRLNHMPAQLQDEDGLDPSERERRRQMREAFALGRQALREELHEMQEAMRELDVGSSRNGSDKPDDCLHLPVFGDDGQLTSEPDDRVQWSSGGSASGDGPAAAVANAGAVFALSNPCLTPSPPLSVAAGQREGAERRPGQAVLRELEKCTTVQQAAAVLRKAAAKRVTLDPVLLSEAAAQLARLQHSKDALDLIFALAGGELDGWTPAAIAKILSAFTAAGHRPSRLFALATAAAQHIGLKAFQRSHIATSVWAFATAGQAAPTFFACVEQELLRRGLSEMDPRSLMTVLRSFATAGHKAPSLFQAAEAEVVTHGWEGFSGQEVAYTLSSFVTAGARLGRLLPSLRDWLASQGVSSLPTSVAASVVRTLAEAFGSDKSLTPPAFAEQMPVLPSAPPARCTRRRGDREKEKEDCDPDGSIAAMLPLFEADISSRMDAYSAQDIAAVLWAFSKLNQPSPHLIALAAAEIGSRGLGVVSLPNLVAVAWVCSGGRQSAMAAAIADEVARRPAPQLAPPELTSLLWACASVAKSLRPSPLVHAAADFFRPRTARRFRDSDLALMLRAVAGAGAATPAFLSRVEAELQRRGFRGFNAERLAELCWSFAASGHRMEAACSTMLGDEIQRRVLKSFPPSHLASVAWAAGCVAGSRAACARCVDEALRRGAAAFAAEDWAAIAEAGVVTGAQELAVFAEEVAAEALQRHQHLPPAQQRAADVHAAAAIVCVAHDKAASADHAIVEVAKRTALFDEDAAASVRSSLSRLGLSPSPDTAFADGWLKVAATVGRVAVDVAPAECFYDGSRACCGLLRLRQRLISADGFLTAVLRESEWMQLPEANQDDMLRAALDATAEVPP
eukprot:TRINITY_DN3724_c2_g1_i1.p1 TRINITY_DN3724_c2_g1~~TRINITY_DN3724_c2_g1_i1.p1  ORF type:complete len:1300 (+),score=238.01 TRINITY_DN3724_c2_g1_i1:60-3959(+)